MNFFKNDLLDLILPIFYPFEQLSKIDFFQNLKIFFKNPNFGVRLGGQKMILEKDDENKSF